jgi:hypothetical protein
MDLVHLRSTETTLGLLPAVSVGQIQTVDLLIQFYHIRKNNTPVAQR